MDNQYLNELIERLNGTEIWRGIDERCSDYSEGIKFLVDIFTVHKERKSQLFFIGNGAVPRSPAI